MSDENENKPKFKSTDVPRNEAGRPIAPQPARKFEAMADQVDDVKEVGGRKEGPNPTRYGDWEKSGRCVDF
jgi:hypothetical protein